MTASVNTVSPAFMLQRSAMRPCHDLMGGTAAMRKAGGLYIEKGEGVSREAFESRLGRTVLLNVYRRTTNFLRGQVFQKQVSIVDNDKAMNKDQVQQFQAWSENVDMRGRNLTSWSGDVFRQGIQDGVTFTLVDFSAVKTRVNADGVTEYLRQDGTWAKKTLAADSSNGWAPYFVHIEAVQVLDAWGTWNGGGYIVDHFRYIETIDVPDGEWAKKSMQQIRVFTRAEGNGVQWQTWRNTDGAKQDFTLHDSGTLSLKEIPVAVFMPGDAVTPWTAEPALIDLADLNIRHWQVSSGHAELMEYVQRPVWFGAGIEDRDDEGKSSIAFGAGKFICSSLPESTIASVGVDPSSSASSRAELDSLKEEMAMYGLQLLQPKQVSMTATETDRDSEENNSTLVGWALDFQDFLENSLRYVAMWWGLEDGPSVSVNTDFAKGVDIRLLLEMKRDGTLSAETVLTIARNAGILPDDFIVEEEQAKIARETSGGSLSGLATKKSLVGMMGGSMVNGL